MRHDFIGFFKLVTLSLHSHKYSYALLYLPAQNCALIVRFVLLEDLTSTRDVWRFASTRLGEPSAMGSGLWLMPTWCADNSVMLQQVMMSIKQILLHRCHTLKYERPTLMDLVYCKDVQKLVGPNGRM